MGCSESKESKPAPAAKSPAESPKEEPTREAPAEEPKAEEKKEEADPAPEEPAAEPAAEPEAEPAAAPAEEPEAPPAPVPAPPAAAAADDVNSQEPMTGRPSELQKVLLKLEMARLAGWTNDQAIATFRAQYEALVKGETGMISEAAIRPVEKLDDHASLPEADGDVADLISKTVVLKLNGGLGTSMGLEKAKSLLEVKDGKKFMDFIVEQIEATRKKHGSDLAFVLMNSFSTADDTKAFLDACGKDLGKWEDINLMQNKVPKINQETMAPSEHPDEEMNWCPPGHGDLYAALYGSGKLSELVAAGKEYLFVSNSDNLGATLDTKILKHFAESDKSFLMEVCERTEADKKGGHLAQKGQGLVLRESAQCPDEDKKEFQNIGKHRYFNTNNLWIKLPALKKLIGEHGGVMKLPLIRNSKTVDPKDHGSEPVYQLETAMGAAIANFGTKSTALVVGRERFAPVKTCNDLLNVRSDAYIVTEDKTLVLAPERNGKAPVVSLGDDYKRVDGLEKLTDGSNAIPSMKHCDMLTLTGMAKLRFSPGVAFLGEVSIDSGNSDDVEVLPAGEHTGDVRLPL